MTLDNTTFEQNMMVRKSKNAFKTVTYIVLKSQGDEIILKSRSCKRFWGHEH